MSNTFIRMKPNSTLSSYIMPHHYELLIKYFDEQPLTEVYIDRANLKEVIHAIDYDMRHEKDLTKKNELKEFLEELRKELKRFRDEDVWLIL